MQLENTAGQTIDAMLFQEVPAFLQYISEKFGETQMQRMLNGTDSEVNISVTYYPTVTEYNGKRTLHIIICLLYPSVKIPFTGSMNRSGCP